MKEGNIYFCEPCQLYIGYSDYCKDCSAPAAKIGWMVTNEATV